MHAEALVICDVCGFEAAPLRRISRTYGSGADLLVIENVPVVSCSNCGTSYMTAETAKQIEQIRRDRLSTLRPVAVARF